MAQKNYFVIVHKDTGEMLVSDGKLPIYWMRKVAKEVAAGFSKYVVKPVDMKELNKLILKKGYNERYNY